MKKFPCLNQGLNSHHSKCRLAKIKKGCCNLNLCISQHSKWGFKSFFIPTHFWQPLADLGIPLLITFCLYFAFSDVALQHQRTCCGLEQRPRHLWNPTIFNMIRWVAGLLEQMTHWPSVWCSKHFFTILYRLSVLKT